MRRQLADEAVQRIVAEVAQAYGASQELVRSSAAFRNYTGADSLDLVELVLALDDELRGGAPPAALA